MELLEERLAPATRVWDGGSLVNSNWSTPANWVGDVAPVPGVDDLQFPSVAARKTNTNDFADASFRGIAFTGSGYTLGGNSLGLVGNLTAGPGTFNNFINLNFLLHVSPTIQVGAGGLLTMNRGMASTFTFGFTKTGTGTLVLRASSGYTGATQLSEGTVHMEHPSALGSTFFGTTIAKGATLRLINILSPAVLSPEPLAFGPGPGERAALVSSVADATWSGPVSLTPGDNQFITEPGRTLRFTGAIGGTGGFRHGGTGTLEFAGTAANTYAGPTQVSRGVLRLNKPAGVTAVPGDLSIGTNDASAGVVTLLANTQIADSSAVTLAGGSGFFGTLNLNGFGDNIGSLSGNGGHVLLGSGTLFTGRNNASTLFGGDITGTGNLVKVGDGTFTLTGASTYSGVTELVGGTLEINGNQPSSRVILTLGVLRGEGTIGPLTVNFGTLSPGRGEGIGRLTVNGDVNLFGPATFRVRLNGTTPGTGFDQLRVIGSSPRTVTLLNPRLEATIGFNAPSGMRFTLIDNTTDNPAPTGILLGMPQGQLFTAPGVLGVPDQAFRMDYTGGNFNDVDMIRNTPPMVEYVLLDPETISAGDSATLVGQLTDPDADDFQVLLVVWGDDSDYQVEFPGLEPFAFSHEYTASGDYYVLAVWVDLAGEYNFRVLPLTVVPAGTPGGSGGRPVASDPSASRVADPRVNAGGPAPVRPGQQTSPVTDVVFGGKAGASTARPDVLHRLTVQMVPPAAGDDVLIGGPGYDVFDGGAGADRTFPEDRPWDIINRDMLDVLMKLDERDRVIRR